MHNDYEKDIYSTFCRIVYIGWLFKKQYNLSPHAFLISVRIDEAKKLLKSGKYMINEIAEKVGYDDIAYFSRLFKLKEGSSPLNYLKRK
jgi:YesN/AraC family two-component response regulator